MKSITRRSFLKNTALVTAAGVLSARSWGQVAGANGDVRIAFVGLNGRGKNLLSKAVAIPGVRVTALCDVDTAVLSSVAASLGGNVKTFVDVRDLLAWSEIDAVVIATPNHWHALAGIWACQAGKDVLVEKPVSHNVWEGRQLVAAAEKYKRVVQAGAQIRSGAGLIEAVSWVRAGNLGKITAARGFCYKFRGSIGKVAAPLDPPATVDYDLWCGPAPLAPLRRKRFHYDWHWQTPTGNGDIGNQGMHQMDVARWFLGEAGLPRHTLSIGGRLGYEDDGDTPNTQIVVHDYATAPLVFEVRGLPDKSGVDLHDPSPKGVQAGAAAMGNHRGVAVGNIIDCEGGYVLTNSYFTATAYDRTGKVVKAFKGTDRLVDNFIEVVRTRKTADLLDPIGEGHVSSALCHIANISHQCGATMGPDAIREKVAGNALLSEAHGRMMEHLATNHIDFSKTPLVMGMPLTLDPARERFTGAEADRANSLLTREYRAPYVVPSMA
jgi:predicted dehydrogenase